MSTKRTMFRLTLETCETYIYKVEPLIQIKQYFQNYLTVSWINLKSSILHFTPEIIFLIIIKFESRY